MDGGCDLQVDVNGEEIFFVNKNILSAFSGRLGKLFNQSSVTSATKTLQVVFHDLPGGPEAFELLTRLCYNNGSIELTPTNACLLHSVAHFMEISEGVSSSANLLKQTKKFLEGISHWTWSEIMNALKQCQDFSPPANSLGLLEKILNSLVGIIVTSGDTSPSGSSPESIGFRFSCDTGSTLSTRNGYHRAWWFDDLMVLNSNTIEKVIKAMVFRRLDHVTISRFLLYYLKYKLSNAKVDEKRETTEIVIDLLYSLDKSSISCKSLFGILRTSSSLKLSKCSKSRLESMIGSQIDQATLDNLLIVAPIGMDSLYDVNVVLRFLKSFLNSGGQASTHRLKKVGSLMDLYVAEVAPDSSLKPSKFVAISTALPDAARDSHDAIYRAIDMYLAAHAKLSEEEKMKICFAINYEKLSSESCKLLVQNPKFPPRMAIQALISQQTKLKNLLQDTNHIKSFSCSPYQDKQCNEGEQIIIYAKKLDLSMENEELKSHLQGMQRRVMELEKICGKMQALMTKIMKSKLSSPIGARSLPKLCS